MNSKSFDYKRIAEGYAKRPWLHQSVMEQIKVDCEVVQSFKNGLLMSVVVQDCLLRHLK